MTLRGPAAVPQYTSALAAGGGTYRRGIGRQLSLAPRASDATSSPCPSPSPSLELLSATLALQSAVQPGQSGQLGQPHRSGSDCQVDVCGGGYGLGRSSAQPLARPPLASQLSQNAHKALSPLRHNHRRANGQGQAGVASQADRERLQAQVPMRRSFDHAPSRHHGAYLVLNRSQSP